MPHNFGGKSMALTPLQIENTRIAYAIMWGIPAKHIDLDTFRQGRTVKEMRRAECGTVGCIGGWLSVHPYFIKQGLTGNGGFKPEVAYKLFGTYYMFSPSAAPGPCWVDGGLKHKREALARLRLHLFENGAITAKRNKALIHQERHGLLV